MGEAWRGVALAFVILLFFDILRCFCSMGGVNSVFFVLVVFCLRAYDFRERTWMLIVS